MSSRHITVQCAEKNDPPCSLRHGATSTDNIVRPSFITNSSQRLLSLSLKDKCNTRSSMGILSISKYDQLPLYCLAGCYRDTCIVNITSVLCLIWSHFQDPSRYLCRQTDSLTDRPTDRSTDQPTDQPTN